MLESLYLENFKAFTEPIEINDMAGKNLIVCGENGSGKSSIFEALHLAFCKDQLLESNIRASLVGPEREAQISQFWRDYTNRKSESTCSIRINSQDIGVFTSTSQACFVNYKSISSSSTIDYSVLVNTSFPMVEKDALAKLWKDPSLLILINKILKEDFREDIELTWAQDEEPIFNVKDSDRNISVNRNVDKYYNEAKIHVIKLSVLFAVINLLKQNKQMDHPLLLFDDIITSLDAANRTLVAKYIVCHFEDCQKIILAHNVSFINLFRYIITLYHQEDKWLYKSLYVCATEHRLVDYKPKTIDDDIKDIKGKYNSKIEPAEDLCNSLRKCFEYLVFEYSRHLQLGDYHEINYYIDAICGQNKKIYLKKSGDRLANIYDLMNEIEGLVTHAPVDTLKAKISETLKSYATQNEVEALIPIMQNIALFRKVILHPMSHAAQGTPIFTNKEFELCLTLVEQLSSVVKGIKNINKTGNVYSV